MSILNDMRHYRYELGKWYRAYGNTIQLVEIVKEAGENKVSVFCPEQNRHYSLYVMAGWKPTEPPESIENKHKSNVLERLDIL